MAEAAFADPIAEAANSLIESPNDAIPAAYEPGRLQDSTPEPSPSSGGLSLEEAANLIADDLPAQHARAGKPVAYHNGLALSLEQLTQGFNAGATLATVLGDLDQRYADVTQAGRNVWIAAEAIAELLAAMFPPPNAAMATTDPIGYEQARVIHETVHNAAVQVTHHAQGISRENAEWSKAQAPQINMAFEVSSFRDAFPKAADPDWLKQFYARVVRVAEHCGFHETELHTVLDHRAFKVLDLAAKALERQQGAASRLSVQPAQPANRPAPRLVASREARLTPAEAMLIDFD